jgi:hypothetical protein
VIRLAVRLLGLALLALAFAAAVIDGAASIAANQLSITPIGRPLYLIFPNKFPLVQAFVEHQIHPLLWDPVLVDILMLPTWLALAVIGVGLFYVVRRRPPPIGHSSRSR